MKLDKLDNVLIKAIKKAELIKIRHRAIKEK